MWVRASPAGTSGGGSNRGTKVRRAGEPSAPNEVCSATSPSTSHTDSSPSTAWIASAATATSCPAEVASTSVRRSTRSASDPPNGESSTIGTAWASPIEPVHTGLWVSCQTWSMTAKTVN